MTRNVVKSLKMTIDEFVKTLFLNEYEIWYNIVNFFQEMVDNEKEKTIKNYEKIFIANRFKIMIKNFVEVYYNKNAFPTAQKGGATKSVEQYKPPIEPIEYLISITKENKLSKKIELFQKLLIKYMKHLRKNNNLFHALGWLKTDYDNHLFKLYKNNESFVDIGNLFNNKFKQSIGSFLIKPFQRLVQFKLMMKEIKKNSLKNIKKLEILHQKPDLYNNLVNLNKNLTENIKNHSQTLININKLANIIFTLKNCNDCQIKYLNKTKNDVIEIKCSKKISGYIYSSIVDLGNIKKYINKELNKIIKEKTKKGFFNKKILRVKYKDENYIAGKPSRKELKNYNDEIIANIPGCLTNNKLKHVQKPNKTMNLSNYEYWYNDNGNIISKQFPNATQLVALVNKEILV